MKNKRNAKKEQNGKKSSDRHKSFECDSSSFVMQVFCEQVLHSLFRSSFRIMCSVYNVHKTPRQRKQTTMNKRLFFNLSLSLSFSFLLAEEKRFFSENVLNSQTLSSIKCFQIACHIRQYDGVYFSIIVLRFLLNFRSNIERMKFLDTT